MDPTQPSSTRDVSSYPNPQPLPLSADLAKSYADRSSLATTVKIQLTPLEAHLAAKAIRAQQPKTTDNRLLGGPAF